MPSTPHNVAFRLTALEHGSWLAIQDGVRQALQQRQLDNLNAPTTLVVHDLLDGALRREHFQLCRGSDRRGRFRGCRGSKREQQRERGDGKAAGMRHIESPWCAGAGRSATTA